NAADYYGLDELRKACSGFVQCCINVDTVCALLASAERYIQYKCTKSMVQKSVNTLSECTDDISDGLEFHLSSHNVPRVLLAKAAVRLCYLKQFRAGLMWSKKHCDNQPNIDLKEVLGNFLEYIQFYKIPANILMKEIHPLGLVPYHIIMNALAYQADPSSIDPSKLSPNRPRRYPGRSMSVQS
ncbi:unnamed protein product, partial [Meganyctiphanes norvegica]